MTISEIDEIFKKYKQNEEKIAHMLTAQENNIQPTPEDGNRKSNNISIQEVQTRNTQILKNLETAKANLRSKAIFSPSEMQWTKIYHNYMSCPSMPITTYKCHKAVYV